MSQEPFVAEFRAGLEDISTNLAKVSFSLFRSLKINILASIILPFKTLLSPITFHFPSLNSLFIPLTCLFLNKSEDLKSLSLFYNSIGTLNFLSNITELKNSWEFLSISSKSTLSSSPHTKILPFKYLYLSATGKKLLLKWLKLSEMLSITKFSRKNYLQSKKYLKIVKDHAKKRLPNEADLNLDLLNLMTITRKRKKTSREKETNPKKRKNQSNPKKKSHKKPQNKKNKQLRYLHSEMKFRTSPFTRYCVFTWKEKKAVNNWLWSKYFWSKFCKRSKRTRLFLNALRCRPACSKI